jgi:hypothetical protein
MEEVKILAEFGAFFILIPCVIAMMWLTMND